MNVQQGLQNELESLRRRARDLEIQLEQANATIASLRDGEGQTPPTDDRSERIQFPLGTGQLWQVADAVPALLCYVDRQFQFRFVNRQFEEWFDRPRREVQGLPVLDVLGAEAFRLLEPVLTACLTGEDVMFDDWLPLPFGRRYVWSRCIPDQDADGRVQGLIMLALDNTERHQAAQATQAANERTRRILESISDGFFTVDSDFLVTDINSQALPFFGSSRAEVIGRNFWDMFPHLIGTEIEREYRRALQQQESLHLEVQSRRDARMWVEIRVSPSRDGLAIFFRDITERKVSEQRLLESEQRLRNALESGRMVAWQYDLRTKSAQFSNTAVSVLGIPAEELMQNRGDGWRMVHPADVEPYRKIVNDAINNCTSYRAQFRVIRPDNGQEIWIEDTGRVICGEDGIAEQIVGIAHDVTERYITERELEEARREADAANRAKSEFVANVSHEIRTPMTAILGYADVLAAHMDDPDNLQCVDTIRRNGRFLLDIISDILDISKIEAGRLELNRGTLQVQSLVAEIQELMRVRADDRGIWLQAEFVGPIPETVDTDPRRLRQILVNLLGNAIKFTERGGVRLVVRHRPEPSQLVFEVIDTGIGISQELQQRLFHPFTQADTSVARQFEGTGLGLSISRRLADMLGGTIELESEMGRGSLFRLIIPVAPRLALHLIEPHAAVSGAERDRRRNAHRLKCHALVVDDRRDVRYLAQHFIEEAGGTVVTASNGREAIEVVARLEEEGNPVDVIVMDIQMPVLDGFAAARTLRAEGFTRPMIALTANAMQGDRDRCLAAGYNDYTSKPIDGPALVSLIDRHIRVRSGC